MATVEPASDFSDPGNGTWINLPNKRCYNGTTYWEWEDFGEQGRGYVLVEELSDISLTMTTVVVPDGTVQTVTAATVGIRIETNHMAINSTVAEIMLRNADGSLDSGTYYNRLGVQNIMDGSVIYSPWIPYAEGTCDTGFPTTTITASMPLSTRYSGSTYVPAMSRVATVTSATMSGVATVTSARGWHTWSSATGQGSAASVTSSTLSSGAIAGIVLGAVLGVLLVGALLLCFRIRQRNRTETREITAYAPPILPSAQRSDVKIPQTVRAAADSESFSASPTEESLTESVEPFTPIAPFVPPVEKRQAPAQPPRAQKHETQTPARPHAAPAPFDYNDLVVPQRHSPRSPSSAFVSRGDSSPSSLTSPYETKSSQYHSEPTQPPRAAPRPAPHQPSVCRQTHEVDAGRLKRLKRPPPPGYSSTQRGE